jgi:hypothetical protein
MASTIPPVLVELQLETANIKNQLANLNKSFESFGATVVKQSSFMEKFKAAAVGMFAGNLMTQGLSMVKSAVQGAIQEAQDYEKATAQLNAAIISTGNVAGLSVAGLQAQASALESLSAQDEVAIMKNQGLLQTFTNVRNVAGEGNDIFNQATLAMLNMGAKMGDNAGSAMQLGKALNDPVRGIGALSRVGVVFTAQQREQVKAMVASGDIMGAQKIILGELETEFGGAAAAAGDTFAGAVFRAKDKVADFTRNLITGLQPILLKIGKTIGDLWNKYLAPLFGWINKNKEAVSLFVGILLTGYAMFKAYAIITGIMTVATELYTVATVLMAGGKLADVVATEAQTGAMALLNAVMNANPIGLVVIALAALAAGFVYAWNHSKTFREVIVTISKAVITYIAFMIRAWGGLIEIILKVVTGPLRLFLGVLEHLPGVGKYAKAGLDMINNGIEGVGDFAEATAKRVEGFKDTLDGLKDKKITLPSFLQFPKIPKVDDTGGADAPGGGLTADQIAAAKAAAKKRAEDLKNAYEDVQTSYDKMNKVIVEAKEKGKDITTDYNKKVASINKDFTKREEKARKDHAEKQASINKDFADKEIGIRKDSVARELAILKSNADKELAIRKDYADKVIQLQVDAENKRASIIQKSKNLLIDSFKSVTTIDIGSLFSASFNENSKLTQTLFDQVKDGVSASVSWWGKIASVGVGGLIGDLKTKLQGAKTLADNAAKLAAQGYSQTFIQQIVAQGAGIGNQMADAILNSSPAAQDELKTLYSDIESISENGVSALADTMYKGMGLANSTLRDEYAQVGKDLAAALQKAADVFTEALAKNSTDLTEELKKNSDDLLQRLQENTDELNKALEENNKDLASTLADIQESLHEALFDAQETYNEAIADLEKDTKKKLAELQSELKKTADIIKELAGAKAAAAVLAASPAASILANVEPVLNTNAGSIYNAGMRPTLGGGYQGYNAEMAYAMSSAGRTTFVSNITGYNLSDPQANATAMANGFRFGQTQAIGTTVGSAFGGNP